jgi:hypothetical protein
MEVAAFIILTVLGLFILVHTIQGAERTKLLKPMETRLTKIEEAVTYLMESVQVDMKMAMNTGEGDGETRYSFRSIDGKYSAETLDDLLEQMAAGGDLKADEKETEILLNFFKNANIAIEKVNIDPTEQWIEEDGEDDDDESEPWAS